MSYFDHSFEGVLEELVYPGKFRYFIVRLTADLAARLPFDTDTRVRVSGEINDLPFHGAWVPAGDKLPYLHLSGDFVGALGLAIGDAMELRFNIASPDTVEMPAELREALSGDPEAAAIWSALTPGRRRGLAHIVGNAKKEETRRKRALKLMDDLRGGTF